MDHRRAGSWHTRRRKTIKLLTQTAAVLITLATAAAADPAVGTWQTETKKGSYRYVQISQCGADLCGEITKTFTDGSEVKGDFDGKMVLQQMKPNGDGTYNGKMLRPKKGTLIDGSMKLSGNVLELEGCTTLVCRDFSWKRIK